METLTMEQLQEAFKAQSPCRELITFKCPACGCLQNSFDLMIAGAGKSFDEVEKYLGFSCKGRWTGAGAPRKQPDGEGCNWTLGGLFQIHKVEIVDEKGERFPLFELVTPEEAEAHRRGQAKLLMGGLARAFAV